MAEGQPQHVFVYGNLRPDAHGAALRATMCRKAWLLGGRLYSVSRGGGVEHAAVRLGEPGHAVMGYVLSEDDRAAFSNMLSECEKREHFPAEGYERDVVEVTTVTGERVASYVYHCPQVDQSRPVHKGDWLGRVE